MQIDLATIESVTHLAQQYGPFLFAILFIFVVTRTAHKYYQESNTRTQPRASEQEKRTYRSYFITSVWMGIALMLLSIGWWIYAQLTGPSIYQMAIVGLRQDESVLSEYYSKTIPRPSIPGAAALHDVYFIVARDRPISIGDAFKFYYFRAPASSNVSTHDAAGVGIAGIELGIKYSGNKMDVYQIAQSGGGFSLKVIESNRETSGPQFASAAATLPKRSE
jgi:hypothetical protein